MEHLLNLKGIWEIPCKTRSEFVNNINLRALRPHNNVCKISAQHMNLCLPCCWCGWEVAGETPLVYLSAGCCLSERLDCQPGPKPQLCPARTASPGHPAKALMFAAAGSVTAAETSRLLSRWVSGCVYVGKVRENLGEINNKIIGLHRHILRCWPAAFRSKQWQHVYILYIIVQCKKSAALKV